MTAQGSRRTAFVLALALLVLIAWWLQPRMARHSASAAGVRAEAARPADDTTAAATARLSGRDDGPGVRAGAKGPAATPEDDTRRCKGTRRRRLLGIQSTLDPTRSADEAFDHALLAAMLARVDHRDKDAERRETLRDQSEWQAAQRRWPGDVDIAWQAANHCQARYGCDQAGALRHLLDLEPGNAAAWMEAMRVASNQGDPVAYDDAIEHAAASTHYAHRAGSVFLRLRPLLAGTPMPGSCIGAEATADFAAGIGREPTDDDWSSVEALSMELAYGVQVAYGAFSGCRADDGQTLAPQRRRDCIAVLSWLGDGDTLIERSIALPILIELAGDTPAGMEYRERYRRMLYLWLAVPRRGIVDGDPMRIMSTGEMEALRQSAIAQHRWPPPDDWLPDAPRQRMLVTRGRAPRGR
jgi:hypothetical protein